MLVQISECGSIRRSSGDGTATIAVKSSPVENPELQIEEGKVDANYFVLCRFPDNVPDEGTHGIVEMVGGATKEMILQRKPRKSLNYGHSNYHVTPEYLLDLPAPQAVLSSQPKN